MKETAFCVAKPCSGPLYCIAYFFKVFLFNVLSLVKFLEA